MNAITSRDKGKVFYIEGASILSSIHGVCAMTNDRQIMIYCISQQGYMKNDSKYSVLKLVYFFICLNIYIFLL